jgi:predicted ATP-grasp superfamily ATP-dependent carboligase
MRDRVSTRVLLAGVSTRAAAESAVRAGFDVFAIDAFGDLDHPVRQTMTIVRPFAPHDAAEAARAIACDALVYLSNFENHPAAVDAIAAGRVVWGNSAPVLRRVRDPLVVMDSMRRRSFVVPEVVVENTDATDPGIRRWLVKPVASGGGHGVTDWEPAVAIPRGSYLQEFVDGTPGSVVFVAAGKRAVSLAVTRQLIGDEAFGSTGFRYCGSILASEHDTQFARGSALVEAAGDLARAATEEFDLVGVNGIDFLARDGVPHLVEINPRWCASMELVERAHGFSVFGAHGDACARGVLPDFSFGARHGMTRVRAVGKAIVFARRDTAVGDTRAWLRDPDVADVPHPGETIRRGRPVCTVFARSGDDRSCYHALVRRAARVYAELDAMIAARACNENGSS